MRNTASLVRFQSSVRAWKRQQEGAGGADRGRFRCGRDAEQDHRQHDRRQEAERHHRRDQQPQHLELLGLHGPVVIQQHQPEDAGDEREVGIKLRRRPGVRRCRDGAPQFGAAHLLQRFRLVLRRCAGPAAAELFQLFFRRLRSGPGAQRLRRVVHLLLYRCRRRRRNIGLRVNDDVPPRRPQRGHRQHQRHQREAEILQQQRVTDARAVHADVHGLRGREHRAKQRRQHLARIGLLQLGDPWPDRNAGFAFGKLWRDLRIRSAPSR